ncbi:hypothetical protein [Mesonia aestuariivivens]|uniref:XRE family transcriptional regulator n=1 Tax=Mesonia aestuariivivens TaxID=2796128 RepID=A0ABS6W075_9FLAO|nr:hypothetical protein [Mesonia aestuariivivens]MBW2961255.1 hypothetical protein [Mesonia aestuariivivens]
MKTLNISTDQKNSIDQYKRAGIYIEPVFEGLEQMRGIKITQKNLFNGYILNQKQLYNRAKEIFPNEKILPVVYSLNVDDISIDWINSRMEEFGIKRNDLIKQLALDKSSLSLYLSGKRKMDKSQKAAFYFYFLTYELNRDFREYINTSDEV